MIATIGLLLAIYGALVSTTLAVFVAVDAIDDWRRRRKAFRGGRR